MRQYLNLMQRVLDEGTWQSNRTGVDCCFVAGDRMRFDLQRGFPVITTRKAAWKSAIGEMIGFIRGTSSVAEFNSLKCKFWDANAAAPSWQDNPNCAGPDNLGRIYGKQWRDWRAQEHDGFPYKLDQFYNAIDAIINNPTSRRIIVSAWRPDEFDQMALPPCHVMYQFLVNVEKRELNLSMFIRSNDLFLGAPANITEYAFLLEAVAHATGYKPRWFNYFVSDAHIYRNHVEVVEEQLTREPFALPRLKFLKPFEANRIDAKQVVEWLESLHPDDFELVGYKHHDPLTASMAV